MAAPDLAQINKRGQFAARSSYCGWLNGTGFSILHTASGLAVKCDSLLEHDKDKSQGDQKESSVLKKIFNFSIDNPIPSPYIDW
jgi:hypothetical protein